MCVYVCASTCVLFRGSFKPETKAEAHLRAEALVVAPSTGQWCLSCPSLARGSPQGCWRAAGPWAMDRLIVRQGRTGPHDGK